MIKQSLEAKLEEMGRQIEEEKRARNRAESEKRKVAEE